MILRLPDARDVDAWDEAVAIYGPLVYRLARRKELQPADADDLVQEVLSAVSRSIEQWLDRPDRGRFRLWLFRIARNTAINFLTRPKHQPLGFGGSEAADWLAEHAAADEVSDEFEAEYRRETFRWASRHVRGSVTAKTWRAFWQTTVENRPIEEVAKELGMSAGNVYVARSRVMARLRKLVRDLEEDES